METATKISTTRRNISQQTFKGLMSDLQLETGNDLDIIGFKSSRGPFQISFFAELNDDYKIIVEDFGMNRMGGGWEIMEPTEEQVKQMQEVINKKEEEIRMAPKETIELQENHGIYSETY